MLLEVARSQRRDDSLDSDGVPAVRLEWTTTGLGFARSVTQPKILRTKARPPSPTIVLARAEFTDNSARKLSLSGRDDNSPPLDEGFSSPPPTSVDAAFVLGTLAEHLTKMTHRRAKRAPRRLTSASPPPPRRPRLFAAKLKNRECAPPRIRPPRRRAGAWKWSECWYWTIRTRKTRRTPCPVSNANHGEASSCRPQTRQHSRMGGCRQGYPPAHETRAQGSREAGSWCPSPSPRRRRRKRKTPKQNLPKL